MAAGVALGTCRALVCSAQGGWWVPPTHGGAVPALSPAQAVPAAPFRALAAGLTPPRAAALLSIPSIVSSGLEAGQSLFSVSQPELFLCTKPGFLSAFRVLSSAVHRRSRPGLQRKRRRQEEAQFLL